LIVQQILVGEAGADRSVTRYGEGYS
jgi:hypothetical protein